MNWFKKHGTTLIFTLILLVGLGFLLYPSFANYWNSMHQTRAIMNYMETVNSMDREEYERILSSAREYNSRLSQTGNKWTLTDEEREDYNQQLNIGNDGNMGYITIDKINVMLPIYHGTSEAVLQTSIGHIEGSSLPVGVESIQPEKKSNKGRKKEENSTPSNEGSHCILSGHRGLPSARLFSDLDQIVEGDTFTLTIMNETMTYQVDQIRVVEPSDLSDLQIVRGQDYVTLVTCTPYGINTHRLLVRGHRVANAQGDAKVVADAIQIDTMYVIPFVGVPILTVLLMILLFRTRRRAKHILSYELGGQFVAEEEEDNRRSKRKKRDKRRKKGE